MRERKFRAWHRHEKCWHYFTWAMLVCGDAGKDSLQYENWCDFVHRKDEVDIYEGDIIEWDIGSESNPREVIQFTDDCSAETVGHGANGKCRHLGYAISTYYGERYTVIGNIHQNPELIVEGTQ